jgi:hypothetical protein
MNHQVLNDDRLIKFHHNSLKTVITYYGKLVHILAYNNFFNKCIFLVLLIIHLKIKISFRHWLCLIKQDDTISPKCTQATQNTHAAYTLRTPGLQYVHSSIQHTQMYNTSSLPSSDSLSNGSPIKSKYSSVTKVSQL